MLEDSPCRVIDVRQSDEWLAQSFAAVGASGLPMD